MLSPSVVVESPRSLSGGVDSWSVSAEVVVGSSDEVDSSLSAESASELCSLDESASESGPLAESAESPPYTP